MPSAAAAPGSPEFVLVVGPPFTLTVTVFVYRVFRGKATTLGYGSPS
jgi:cytochrome bd-type quinol oxidase subunit 2